MNRMKMKPISRKEARRNEQPENYELLLQEMQQWECEGMECIVEEDAGGEIHPCGEHTAEGVQ